MADQTPRGARPHSAKSSQSHEHVYCGARGPLHEWLHVTPLPPPSVFTGAQCVPSVGLCLCVLERNVVVRADGARPLQGRCLCGAQACPVLAGAYVHTNARRQRLIVDTPAQLVSAPQ